MSRNLTAEFYVPREFLTAGSLQRTLEVLRSSGFLFEAAAGHGVHFAVDTDWHGPVPLEFALRSIEFAEAWAVKLWKEAATGRLVDLVLSVERGVVVAHPTLDLIHLSTYLPPPESDSVLALEFLAWSLFLAELTPPWYGWAGSALGLFDRETVPVSPSSVAAAELQPIEWLNVFGSPYIQKLRLSQLLSVPAGHFEFLANGSVAICLGRHPDLVRKETAVSVAQHLGLPVGFPT
jgi:hypothetical protein